jgi:uncharacterized protein
MFRLTLVAAGICLAGGGAGAQTPAWCAAETLTPTARTICDNPELGALELELEDALGDALDVSPDIDQGAWLADRGRCGTDADCLARAYRNRIVELRLVAAQGWPDGSGAARDIVAALAEVLFAAWPGEAAPFTPDPAQHMPPPGRERPEALARAEERLPRPWCDGGELNVTERTICAEPVLSRLDALLALAYGDARAEPEDAVQARWIDRRDACGPDTLCIAQAYAYRIVNLFEHAEAPTVLPQRTPEGASVDIPPGHMPPPGSCRVWYPGRPPGQQPPPGDCDVAVPEGAVLIEN